MLCITNVIFVILAAILASTGLMEEVGRFSGNGAGFRKMMQLAVLSAPRGLYEFLPLFMILSSLAVFLRLGRRQRLECYWRLG